MQRIYQSFLIIVSFTSFHPSHSQRTDPIAPNEQVCISSSSIPSIAGTYTHSSFDSTTNGAIYFNSHNSHYLYPHIANSRNKNYLISTDHTQTIALSTCKIPIENSVNILNPDDCYNHWIPFDVTSVNCNDICISGSAHDFLDGTYEWIHFNVTSHSSVYHCNSCVVTAYLFGYVYEDTSGIHHNWRIGPNYPHPAAWSSCWIKTNETQYKFDINDCLGWDDAVRFQWIDSALTARKCVNNVVITTQIPTITPIQPPTGSPTMNPSIAPIKTPTANPSVLPSLSPTNIPSITPTKIPSVAPTLTPAQVPTQYPTNNPTIYPTNAPTNDPSHRPTEIPTFNPTDPPSLTPTDHPITNRPTFHPTTRPTQVPSVSPTSNPFIVPTVKPTQHPTNTPSNTLTESPSYYPSIHPSDIPTVSPSNMATLLPTLRPTWNPIKRWRPLPTHRPTNIPTISPYSHTPTTHPSDIATTHPSNAPTTNPSIAPSSNPTYIPTHEPTVFVPNPSTVNPTAHIITTTSSDVATTRITTQSSTTTTSTITITPTGRTVTLSPTIGPIINPSLSPTIRPVVPSFSFPTHKPTLSPTQTTRIPTPPLIDGPDRESSSAEVNVETTMDGSLPVGFTTNIIIFTHHNINEEWVSFQVSLADLSCGGDITSVNIMDDSATHWISPTSIIGVWYEYDAINTSFKLPISIQITKENEHETLESVHVIQSWDGSTEYDFGDNFCKTTEANIFFYSKNTDVDAAFHYFVVSICAIFIIFGFVAFIDGKCLRRNDYFDLWLFISSLIQVLCVMSYLFFINDIFGNLHGDNALVLIFGLSIVFIMSPMIISFGHLFKEKASPYWLFNDRIREWMSRYTELLYFYSVITGSAFTAIEIFNSNIFGLDLFFMGIPKQFLYKFRIKKVFALVICSNFPQMVLVVCYALILGYITAIPLIAMLFSILSIAITFIAICREKAIYSTQNHICVTVDVTGPSMFDNKRLSTNRIRSIRKYLCENAFEEIDDRTIQFMRPHYGVVTNGLQIQIHIAACADINILKLEDSLNNIIDTNILHAIIQKEWKLSAPPKIGNISCQFVTSNAVRRERNGNEEVVTEEEDDEDYDHFNDSESNSNTVEILGLWKAITNFDAKDGSEQTYTEPI